MVLTIDVGNTRISMGAFKGDELVFTSSMSSVRNRTRDQYAIEILEIFSLYSVDRQDFDGAIISSVVPEMSNTIRDAVEKAINCKPLMLGPGVKTGLNIRVDEPTQVGVDFVALSVAACKKFKTPCLVVDLKTATKISIIDSNNTFIGAIICPGVEISMKALADKTSQLPKISISAPKKVVGKNTIDCMASGVVYGTSSMLDGLCDRVEKELGQECTVVATGSFAQGIIPHCKREMVYCPNLIFEGLKIIYDKNMGK